MTATRVIRSGRAALHAVDSATSGPALVCLHAGVCDRRMWSSQMQAFGTAHRVVAYDRRGFGETRYEPERFSHVDDLMVVLDALQIERTTLMGCSMGGKLAIDAALAHPDRVGALVLVANSVSGAPVDGDGPFEPVVQALVERLEAAEAAGDFATLNELEAHAWLDGPAQAAGRIGGDARELFLAMNAIALAAAPVGEVIAPLSAWDRLVDIRVPTQVIVGDADFAHIVVRASEIARRIAGAGLAVMNGVAHLPSIEQPTAFNAIVASFLQRLR